MINPADRPDTATGRGAKLTPARQRVLDELKKPGARAIFMGGYYAHWFISPTLKRCTIQAEWLLAHGYLTVISQDWNGRVAVLKENV